MCNRTEGKLPVKGAEEILHIARLGGTNEADKSHTPFAFLLLCWEGQRRILSFSPQEKNQSFFSFSSQQKLNSLLMLKDHAKKKKNPEKAKNIYTARTSEPALVTHKQTE